MGDSLKAILYERAEGGGRRATLQLLDQRVIPYSHEYMDITNCVDGWKAINSMVVRGAPAIAIAGVLSLAVELANDAGSAGEGSEGVEEARRSICDKLKYLVTSRPTAVNLAIAARDLTQLVTEASAKPGATGRDLAEAVIAAAEELMIPKDLD